MMRPHTPSEEHTGLYLVMLTRSGPEWDRSATAEQQTGWSAHAAFMEELVAQGVVVLGGPLHDDRRVVLVVDAEDDDSVRATLADDPWSGSHLLLEAVEAWTIRLDGRRR